MAFGGTDYLSYIPRLRTYAAAEKAYNEIKPLRGSKEDIRPIGLRRRKFERIEKHLGPNGPEYHVVNCGVSILVYQPDNKIRVNPPNWGSSNLAAWLTRILGTRSIKYCNRMWLGVGGNAIPLVSNNLVVWEDETQTMRHNVEAILRRAVDRKAASVARKRVKPFMDYGMTMLKMSDGLITDETVAASGHSKVSNLHLRTELHDAEVFAKILSGDENEWLSAFVYVAFRWTPHRTRNFGNGMRWMRVFDANAFKRGLTRLHDYYSPEIYYIDEVTQLPTNWVAMTNIVGLKTK